MGRAIIDIAALVGAGTAIAPLPAAPAPYTPQHMHPPHKNMIAINGISSNSSSIAYKCGMVPLANTSTGTGVLARVVVGVEVAVML
jgi:hypothetical protein